MWNIIKNLFKQKDLLADYPDISPRGFKTTYPGVKMTVEEKNDNFTRISKELFKAREDEQQRLFSEN